MPGRRRRAPPPLLTPSTLPSRPVPLESDWLSPGRSGEGPWESGRGVGTFEVREVPSSPRPRPGPFPHDQSSIHLRRVTNPVPTFTRPVPRARTPSTSLTCSPSFPVLLFECSQVARGEIAETSFQTTPHPPFPYPSPLTPGSRRGVRCGGVPVTRGPTLVPAPVVRRSSGGSRDGKGGFVRVGVLSPSLLSSFPGPRSFLVRDRPL